MAKQPDQWAEHFRRALIVKCRLPAGEGWITRAEFQRRGKIGKNRATDYLCAEVRAGRMEKFDGSQFVNGRGTRLVWYRPKPKK